MTFEELEEKKPLKIQSFFAQFVKEANFNPKPSKFWKTCRFKPNNYAVYAVNNDHTLLSLFIVFFPLNIMSVSCSSFFFLATHWSKGVIGPWMGDPAEDDGDLMITGTRLFQEKEGGFKGTPSTKPFQSDSILSLFTLIKTPQMFECRCCFT